jgi:hypothetical protein
VLEVNAEHPLVKKLDGSVHFHDLAHILFDQALLAEGGLPDDPAALRQAGECAGLGWIGEEPSQVCQICYACSCIPYDALQD